MWSNYRSEIASCLENAYADISCSDAARMLSISAGSLSINYIRSASWATQSISANLIGTDQDLTMLLKAISTLMPRNENGRYLEEGFSLGERIQRMRSRG